LHKVKVIAKVREVTKIFYLPTLFMYPPTTMHQGLESLYFCLSSEEISPLFVGRCMALPSELSLTHFSLNKSASTTV
jgi:hypothetical protein